MNKSSLRKKEANMTDRRKDILMRDLKFIESRSPHVKKTIKDLNITFNITTNAWDPSIPANALFRQRRINLWPPYFEKSAKYRRFVLRHEIGHFVFYQKFGYPSHYLRFTREVFSDLYSEEPELMKTKGFRWIKETNKFLLNFKKKLKITNNELYYMFESEYIKQIKNNTVREILEDSKKKIRSF
jgi:G3E family GTPase